MKRWVLWMAGCWCAAGAVAYDQPAPKYINADITWRDAAAGSNRTSRGQLWFKDFPRVVDASGRTRGFGSLGYYTGIKWFVPKNPGEIWLERQGGDAARPTFRLQDHFGEEDVIPAFDRIDVFRTEESSFQKRMEDKVDEVVNYHGETIKDEQLATLSLDGSKPEETITLAVAPGVKGGSPLSLATERDIGVRAIAVSNLVKIVFLDASDGLRREVYTGRFVQYSNVAAGDEGRVQVRAATFFGGPDGGERFAYGDFLRDGSIVLAGNFVDLGFVDPALVKVFGADPPADAYPPVEVTDNRGRTRTEEPRRTAVVAVFSADLKQVLRVLRPPWGSGTVDSVAHGGDDAIYLAGRVGPHFDTLTGAVGRCTVVENPQAIEEAAARKREPGADGYVMKLAVDRQQVEWLVRFKHAGVNIFLRPDGRLLARRGAALFFIAPDAAVAAGPSLEIAGSNMAVDPRTGDMYFGGSYRSGTGLEPYVNPYVYKVAPDGRQVWTAYGWSGPIVGVSQLRLVSDSSVNSIKVAEDGSLTLTGWSDGGNTVLSAQPYDLRKTAPGGGFASEVWGATGGLTVRIAHIIHMDANTTHVDYCTRYVSYLPTSDVPTLLNIYDTQRLPNGDVAVVGGARTGLIETHDAWITPWYVQYRTNEFAQAKSGTFLTVFRPDFSRPRMSTRTPGVSGGQLAARGNLLLLYGGATGNLDAPGARRGPWSGDPIVTGAVQPVNGGGLDGYAMLIDTQGPPRPPVIPDWSWGEHAEKRGRKR